VYEATRQAPLPSVGREAFEQLPCQLVACLATEDERLLTGAREGRRTEDRWPAIAPVVRGQSVVSPSHRSSVVRRFCTVVCRFRVSLRSPVVRRRSSIAYIWLGKLVF